MKKWVE